MLAAGAGWIVGGMKPPPPQPSPRRGSPGPVGQGDSPGRQLRRELARNCNTTRILNPASRGARHPRSFLTRPWGCYQHPCCS